MAHFGLEHIINRICFVEVPRSMSRLEAISKDPASSPLVNTLVYEMDLPFPLNARVPFYIPTGYPDYPSDWATPNHQAYIEDVCLLRSAEFERTDPEATEYKKWKLYQTYKSYYLVSHDDEQQDVHQILKFEERLAQIMARLPNLKRLICFNERTVLNCFKKRTHLEYRGPSSKQHYEPLYLIPENENLLRPSFSAWQLEALLVAAAKSQKNLTTLGHYYLS